MHHHTNNKSVRCETHHRSVHICLLSVAAMAVWPCVVTPASRSGPGDTHPHRVFIAIFRLRTVPSKWARIQLVLSPLPPSHRTRSAISLHSLNFYDCFNKNTQIQRNQLLHTYLRCTLLSRTLCTFMRLWLTSSRAKSMAGPQRSRSKGESVSWNCSETRYRMENVITAASHYHPTIRSDSPRCDAISTPTWYTV